MITKLSHTLRIARQTHRMTLKEIAAATGISGNHLSRLENGRIRKPSLETLAKLAHVYGISYQMLLDLSGRETHRGLTEPSHMVPQLILNAAEVLTQEDWLILQGMVEGMVAVRREGMKNAIGSG
jgi:transcriptional regulator with XRE-family HTH domain